MHIKYLEIENFKSYKEKIFIDQFSSRHNSVIGRNGSGKSNFFKAIQFVLCEEEYTHLSAKDKQDLIHESNGETASNAYVEICFDNTDGRFQIDSDEVVIRRTLGQAKDVIKINGKTVTRTEVIDHLETAGFSRANPYYVVQQGKVNALCLMKDNERLELLRSLAGTTLFEDKKKQSLRLLEEEKRTLDQIDQKEETLNKKVAQLEKEQENVKKWKEKSEERDVIQHIIYSTEKGQCQKKIEEIQRNCIDLEEGLKQGRSDIKNKEEKLLTYDDSLKNLRLQLALYEKQKTDSDDKHVKLLQKRNEIELTVSELRDKESLSVEEEDILRKQLRKIEDKIQLIQYELEQTLHPQLTAAKSIQHSIQNKVKEVETSVQAVHLKVLQVKDKKSQFKNQKERDTYIAQEVANLNEQRTNVLGLLKELQREADAAKVRGSELSNRIESLLEAKKVNLARASELDALHDKEKSGFKVVVSERVEKWRKIHDLQNQESIIGSIVGDIRKDLKKFVGVANYVVHGQVKEIAIQLGLQDKVFGPLYELIRVKSIPAGVDEREIMKALEISAGNQLNHVVCDSDLTCTKMINELGRRGYGRCTFKPLINIKERYQEKGKREARDKSDELICDVKMFNMNDSDCLPIGEFIAFTVPDLQFVIRSVFGKTLFCFDSQKLDDLRNRYEANFITREGKLLESRGMFQGGYVDINRSTLYQLQSLRSKEDQLQQIRDEKNSLQVNVDKVGQQVVTIENGMQKLQADRSDVDNVLKQIEREISALNKDSHRDQSNVKSIETQIEKATQTMQDIEQKIDALKAALQQPMQKDLNHEDVELLAKLEADLLQLRKEASAQTSNVLNAEAAVKAKELELQSSLIVPKNEILEKLDKMQNEHQSAGSKSRQLKEQEEILRELGERLAESSKEGKKLETRISTLIEKQRSIEVEKLILEEEIKNLQDRHASFQGSFERYESKKSIEEDKIEKLNAHLKEIRSPPSHLLKKYERKAMKVLWSQIKALNDELGQFSDLNKLAIEQFMAFSEERQRLHDRKDELIKSREGINELIVHLEAQKDEVINKTVDQVRTNFSKVFKELVPIGKGRLVPIIGRAKKARASMPRQSFSASQQQGADLEDIETQPEEGVIGISPRVIFDATSTVDNDDEDDTGPRFLSMNELSGGQKALVALCLIFAIQRCDPAPFYLFDEIDQALDEKNRIAVAELIKRQASVSNTRIGKKIIKRKRKHQVNDDESDADVSTEEESEDEKEPAIGGTQFITTTFRPELVSVSDQVLAVSCENRISKVQPLQKVTAMKFIQTMAEEEADEIEEQSKRAREALEKS